MLSLSFSVVCDNLRYNNADPSCRIGYLQYRFGMAEGAHVKHKFSTQTSSPTTQSSTNATACPPSGRVTTTNTSSCLSAYTDVVSCRRCGRTPWPSTPATSSRACSWCGFCPPAVLLDLPRCCLFPCLLFGSSPLSSLLTVCFFLFNINQIL
jgi:ribosomal protein L37E